MHGVWIAQINANLWEELYAAMLHKFVVILYIMMLNKKGQCLKGWKEEECGARDRIHVHLCVPGPKS